MWQRGYVSLLAEPPTLAAPSPTTSVPVIRDIQAHALQARCVLTFSALFITDTSR